MRQQMWIGSEFKKAFKHMIYTYYQRIDSMGINENNNPSNIDHDNSKGDSKSSR